MYDVFRVESKHTLALTLRRVDLHKGRSSSSIMTWVVPHETLAPTLSHTTPIMASCVGALSDHLRLHLRVFSGVGGLAHPSASGDALVVHRWLAKGHLYMRRRYYGGAAKLG